MAFFRHKSASSSSMPLPARLVRVGVPVAAAAVLGTSAAAVAWPETKAQSTSAISMPAPEVRVKPEAVPVRVAPISRSADRVELKEKPPKVEDQEYASTLLNVWSEPTEKSKLVDVLDEREKIAVSEDVQGAWAEVVVDKKSLWVHRAYLVENKPEPPEPEPVPEPAPAEESAPAAAPEEEEVASSGGLSTAECASGSDVESGLVPNAVAVHRAVCAAFPEVTTYGGVRPGDDDEHGTGQALDIMISDSGTGDAIADFARDNADALGVSEVIWAQQIWTVERSSEGWRYMEDRGSDTANHYDHVHVTVY
ncbi:SH3 domain-containing protein [Nocardioides jiangsuensis]|nr:SH3 domain-containing protein [Nocardioides jiangsuensis]